ncbi:MAG: Crp/Fnr family transcriptional regulator [Rhodoferax sp.]
MGTTHQYAFGAQQNQLLAAMPSDVLNRWQGRLELVELSRNQLLYSAGCSPEYVYFPTTAIVSMLSITQEGSSAEVALVGNDGVAGISYLLGVNGAVTDAVVQSSGRAFRISARFIKEEVETSFGVMKVVMRYAQSVMGQMAQTAVCNRYHSIDQQLCRRILSALDRLPTDELDMTHELAANLLGVRREGVTVAARKLQEAGLIRYSRGHIAVLDRARLEQRTCECYAPAKAAFSRLLPQPLAA